MIWTRSFRLAMITFMFFSSHASVASADSPSEQVKKTIDRVIEILHESNGQGKTPEQREMLRRTLVPRFDFPDMARRSLGNHWKNQNGRQEEFVAVFTEFVGNAYMTKIESLKDEKIVFGRERLDNQLAEVDTKIVSAKGEPVSINYRLHLKNGEWKVYDVVIDNISVVNNYRSQFNRFLAGATFDELVKKLQKTPEKGS
jgi:phospholipid transport system substrate-binding protein